jgi:hypothetical protein
MQQVAQQQLVVRKFLPADGTRLPTKPQNDDLGRRRSSRQLSDSESAF